MLLVNINEHPTNQNKKVFFFKELEQAHYFENLLRERKIEFEMQVDEDGDQTIYYGINKSDFDQVKKLNYLTLGAFRKPFIPDKVLRVFVILISIIVLGLAFTGAWLSN